jgi:hypothetical protein
VVGIEYAGYGIYKDEKPSEEKIIEDSEKVINYLINKFKI